MKTVPQKKTIYGSGLAVLWTLRAIAGDVPGSTPGDDTMTCQQIGAELAPYAQQMSAVFAPLAQTNNELLARSQARMAESASQAAAVSAGALATSADPTGMSSKAYGQAEVAMQRQAWNRALAEDKPLMDQARTQTNEAIAQAMPMQANPRIQRLMQLAQRKNCQ